MQSYYFDHAASSRPKAPGVGRAMADYLDNSGVNVGRGGYAQALDAALTLLHTREQLCRLFNFKQRPMQAIFTPGATWGLNMLLRGYLRPGDHVVVSSLEHNAVMRPLTELAEQGVEFSRIPADQAGRTRARDITPLLRPNTRLVMVSHASNVCGTVFPLEEVAAICRSRSLPLAVDAAQTAGHLPIDFTALGLAALAVPGHKGLRGPQGIGALLLEQDFAQQLRPLISGGTGSASDSERQPDYLPDKFESGTMNLPGVFGLHAALEYLLSQDMARLREKEQQLTAYLLEELAPIPAQRLRIVGPRDPQGQVGVISLDFCGQDNGEAAFRLEQEFGVLSRCGLHCAPNAHRTLGTFPQGTVRLSLGHDTAAAHIAQAAAAVRAIAESR